MKSINKLRRIFLYSFVFFASIAGIFYIVQDYEQIKPLTIKLKAYLGDSESERLLGYFYMSGKFEEKNMDKAVYWLEKSSKHDNDEAMMLLGHIYENAEPEKRDIKKANELYMNAAKHGNVLGQYYAGNMYYYGKSIEQNKMKALAWYACSTLQQDETEVTFQSILVELLPKDMTPLEVQKSKIMARYFFNLYVKPYNEELKDLDIDKKLTELISTKFPIEEQNGKNIKF